MKVHSYFHNNPLRNFSYLIENESSEAILIDPFEGTYWIDFLEKHKLKLIAIFFTHDHYDHYEGEKDFDRSITRIAFTGSNLPFKFQAVVDHEIILPIFLSDNKKLRINHTKGHTNTHNALEIIKDNKLIAIFSGDCLFNAGIGNVKHGGNLEDMYQTIMRLSETLSEEAILYPGHDYFVRNLDFNISIKDKHQIALELLESIKVKIEKNGYEFNTIKSELEINPFYKIKDFKKFAEIRELRNNF